MNILTLDALRTLYAPARERSVKKELTHLDAHCLRFVALSPFVVIASSGVAGALDASPCGGVPGFVKAQGSGTLLIPDSPGNNRLDTLENIIQTGQTGQIGLLFLVLGLDESLRVNGRATLSTNEANLTVCAEPKRRPKLVIRVTVEEAYRHCAKALMRLALWDPARHIDRAALPSMGEMLKDQIGGDLPAETQAEMLVRYAQDLRTPVRVCYDFYSCFRRFCSGWQPESFFKPSPKVNQRFERYCSSLASSFYRANLN